MILDSTNDKQHENTDATPDSDTQATADSATATIHTSEDASTEASEAAAAETHEASATDDTTVSETAEAETADEVEADEVEADEGAESSENAATVSSATAAPRASLPTKAVAAVLMLAFVGAAFLFIQRSSSKPVSYNLTKHDMEVIFQEMIPPQQQAQMAASPEDKKKLIDEVRKLLSVAAYAESQGYAQRPEVQAQLALQTDLGLNEAYRKKYPEVQVGDDEVNAYYQSHPNEFDTFLQTNPRFQQQATGPNRDNLRKEYGKLKILAERARKEKIDEADDVRLEMLIKRSDVLNNAYLSDLDKDPSKLGISDAEIEQYYQEHQGDFEEARTRIILISTQAQPPAPDAAKKGEQPKAPSKEEARKKAEEALAKARKGEDFVALVKQYSDNPDKDKGGETTLPSAQMPPDLVNLKPGEISNIIETPNGYVIVKLEERKAGAGPSDPKIHQQIINKLKKDKIDAKIDEIAKNSKVSVPEDFDMKVKEAELPQLPTGHPTVPSDK